MGIASINLLSSESLVVLRLLIGITPDFVLLIIKEYRLETSLNVLMMSDVDL